MLSYLWNQGENGICCPLGMTYSAVPALRLQPELARSGALHPLDPIRPAAGPMRGKTGGTVGMTLTEKQAGSDCARHQTTARPATARRGPGEAYLIDGHRGSSRCRTAASSSPWPTPIAASPASAARLAARLAQSPTDPASERQMRQQVDASSEIEYRGALGWLVARKDRASRQRWP
jgi:putative acyl-CoA dehydrogenase